jgi:hypothetical protein
MIRILSRKERRKAKRKQIKGLLEMRTQRFGLSYAHLYVAQEGMRRNLIELCIGEVVGVR